MNRLKNLQLDRPVAFIDFETTGTNPAEDRIIELTVLKIYPDGTEEFKSTRINPQIPIPPGATAIHGITDEDVTGKPIFRQYASSLRDFLRDCDIGGFGVKRFDLPILEAEFRRAGVEFSRQGRRILDAMVIYHKLEPRDLTAAYKKYCGKELAGNHASKADVQAAVEVLAAQLDMYSELPRDIAGIHEYCYPEESNWLDAEGKFIWLEGEARLGFGRQYKGKSLKEIARIDPGYIRWIANADFSAEVRGIAAKALEGEFPKPLLQQTEAQKHVDNE